MTPIGAKPYCPAKTTPSPGLSPPPQATSSSKRWADERVGPWDAWEIAGHIGTAKWRRQLSVSPAASHRHPCVTGVDWMSTTSKWANLMNREPKNIAVAWIIPRRYSTSSPLNWLGKLYMEVKRTSFQKIERSPAFQSTLGFGNSVKKFVWEFSSSKELSWDLRSLSIPQLAVIQKNKHQYKASNNIIVYVQHHIASPIQIWKHTSSLNQN